MTLTIAEPSELRADENECVLVVAPIGQDGAMLLSMLRSVRLTARQCTSIQDVCAQLPDCHAVLLTAEALTESTVPLLERKLQEQPPWSDVPVILLAGKDYPALETALRAISNATVIQRPVSRGFLLSVVQSAVRARKRQYEVRDLLERSARQQADILALNERLRYAMRETHHRVKNNLQVITAMINMQRVQHGDSIPASELDRLVQHIRALAAIHDVLTQQAKSERDTAVVEIEEITSRMLPAYEAMLPPDRTLTSQIEPIVLPVRQATSFALILNELVSNAIKHGQGGIEVSLRVSNQKGHLAVLDGGPGFPDEFDVEASANTGLELVHSLSVWDLCGDVAFGRRPEGGGRVEVNFPVPDLEKTAGEG